MKKGSKFLFVFAVFALLLMVTPVYAMYGTDGTVDTPTNRMGPDGDVYDFDLDHDEIETGEDYQNIVPINDTVDINNEEETAHPAVYIVTGLVVVIMAASIAFITRNKQPI